MLLSEAPGHFILCSWAALSNSGVLLLKMDVVLEEVRLSGCIVSVLVWHRGHKYCNGDQWQGGTRRCCWCFAADKNEVCPILT